MQTLSETCKELRFTKMYLKCSIALKVCNFDTLKCVKVCSLFLRIYRSVIFLHILFVLFYTIKCVIFKRLHIKLHIENVY